MTRREREHLEQRLALVHRRALEPTDASTSERMAQAIEDLEFQLFAARLAARTEDFPIHPIVNSDFTHLFRFGATYI